MMSDKKDGGSAFPLPNPLVSTGLSKREFYALGALIGAMSIMGNPKMDVQKGLDATNLAKSCFEVADAMITESKKESAS